MTLNSRMAKIVLMLLWDLVVMLNYNALGTGNYNALYSTATKAFKMSQFNHNFKSSQHYFFFFFILLYLHFVPFDHTALSYTLEAI